jgi:hypothetical protein
VIAPGLGRGAGLPALAGAAALCLLGASPSRADTTQPAATGAQPAAGGPSQWSVGLTLGAPFAVSVRQYRGDRPLWDANLAFAFGPGARLWGDLLFPLKQVPVSAGESSAAMQVYAGAGLLAGLLTGPCGIGWRFNSCGGDAYFGARGAIGVEALFRKSSFVVGVELAPGLAVGDGKLGFLVDLFLAARLLL